MITGTHPHDLPAAVQVDYDAAADIGRALQTGKPMAPLVGEERVRQAIRNQEPLIDVEKELDAKENQV